MKFVNLYCPVLLYIRSATVRESKSLMIHKVPIPIGRGSDELFEFG